MITSPSSFLYNFLFHIIFIVKNMADFSHKMKKSDKSYYIYEKTCQFDMSVRFIPADSNTSESFR